MKILIHKRYFILSQEIKRQKALQREQLKLEDLRIIEYMKEKEVSGSE